jgi:hypothetical protein
LAGCEICPLFLGIHRRRQLRWPGPAAPAAAAISLNPGLRTADGLGVHALFHHVHPCGLRYSDIANQQVLPDYYTLDAGAVAELGQHFEVRVQGSNLTNQLGLTEGNARIAHGAGSGISGGLEMARPIFGREIDVQLRYKFRQPAAKPSLASPHFVFATRVGWGGGASGTSRAASNDQISVASRS